MIFVLDNSISMRWCFGDGKPTDLAYADKVMGTLVAGMALVPTIWALEVVNVLVRAELKGEIPADYTTSFLARLKNLQIVTDHNGDGHAFSDTLQLARRHHLSAYDAAYLELALRKQFPLATLDASLRKAAKRAGVKVF